MDDWLLILLSLQIAIIAIISMKMGENWQFVSLKNIGLLYQTSIHFGKKVRQKLFYIDSVQQRAFLVLRKTRKTGEGDKTLISYCFVMHELP